MPQFQQQKHWCMCTAICWSKFTNKGLKLPTQQTMVQQYDTVNDKKNVIEGATGSVFIPNDLMIAERSLWCFRSKTMNHNSHTDSGLAIPCAWSVCLLSMFWYKKTKRLVAWEHMEWRTLHNNHRIMKMLIVITPNPNLQRRRKV